MLFIHSAWECGCSFRKTRNCNKTKITSNIPPWFRLIFSHFTHSLAREWHGKRAFNRMHLICKSWFRIEIYNFLKKKEYKGCWVKKKDETIEMGMYWQFIRKNWSNFSVRMLCWCHNISQFDLNFTLKLYKVKKTTLQHEQNVQKIGIESNIVTEKWSWATDCEGESLL